MNPDSILGDPDYKELDGSDMKWCFELDKMTVEEFEREFPDAEAIAAVELNINDPAMHAPKTLFNPLLTIMILRCRRGVPRATWRTLNPNRSFIPPL